MTPPVAAAAPHRRQAQARPPTHLSPTKWERSACAPDWSAPRTVPRGGPPRPPPVSRAACAATGRMGSAPIGARRRIRLGFDRLASNRSTSSRHCAAVRRARCLVPPVRLMSPLSSVSWGAVSESDGTPDQNNGLLWPLTFRREPGPRLQDYYPAKHVAEAPGACPVRDTSASNRWPSASLCSIQKPASSFSHVSRFSGAVGSRRARPRVDMVERGFAQRPVRNVSGLLGLSVRSGCEGDEAMGEVGPRMALRNDPVAVVDELAAPDDLERPAFAGDRVLDPSVPGSGHHRIRVVQESGGLASRLPPRHVRRESRELRERPTGPRRRTQQRVDVLRRDSVRHQRESRGCRSVRAAGHVRPGIVKGRRNRSSPRGLRRAGGRGRTRGPSTTRRCRRRTGVPLRAACPAARARAARSRWARGSSRRSPELRLCSRRRGHGSDSARSRPWRGSWRGRRPSRPRLRGFRSRRQTARNTPCAGSRRRDHPTS